MGNNDKLLTIYGAKASNDGTKLVVTLVGGEGKDKTFYTTCIKLDGSQKTTAEIEEDGEHALIRLVMLQPKEESDGLPF